LPLACPVPDGCQSLGENQGCPITTGDNVTYSVGLDISPAYPKVSLQGQWILTDDDGEVAMCMEIPIVIKEQTVAPTTMASTTPNSASTATDKTMPTVTNSVMPSSATPNDHTSAATKKPRTNGATTLVHHALSVVGFFTALGFMVY